MSDDLPLSVTLEVRDRCLCLHLRRAARTVARRFDEALRPHGLTNGQFSILMSLNRLAPPRISDLAPFLAMDRTTLTAAIKPLERRGLLTVAADPADRRNRHLVLTDAGRTTLAQAVPTWRRTHDAIDQTAPPTAPADLCATLEALATTPRTVARQDSSKPSP